jgi:hypothetical protein
MVSLELVGEVFEVRTQVDRDLTTVSRADRRLSLIKNLGRHSYIVFCLHNVYAMSIDLRLSHVLKM